MRRLTAGVERIAGSKAGAVDGRRRPHQAPLSAVEMTARDLGAPSPSVFRYPTRMMQARNVYWLITLQWLAHFADEWMFGLPDWCTRHFAPAPASFWVPMMTVLTVPMIMVGWAASRPAAGPGIRLFCAGVQMLFFSNAFFHLITTFVFGEYSPGTATAVGLSVPLSLPIWREVC